MKRFSAIVLVLSQLCSILAQDQTTASIFNDRDSTDGFTWNSNSTTQEDTSQSETDNTTIPTTVTAKTSQSGQGGFISENQFQIWRTIVWRALYPPTCIVGIVLNGLGLATMSRMKIQCSFQYCLLTLLIVDQVYLISNLLWCIPKIVEAFDLYLANFLEVWSESFFNTFTHIAFSSATYVITFMSVERLLGVSMPLKMININIKRYTLPILVCLILMNIGIMMPMFLVTRAEAYYNQEHNRTMYKMVRTDFGIRFSRQHNPLYIHFILTLTKFAPLFIVVLSNVLLCCQLIRRKTRRMLLFGSRLSNTNQTAEMRMTACLILFSVFLAISLIPSTLTYFLERSKPDIYGRGGPQYYFSVFVNETAEYLQVISTSNDFLIYVYNSSQTRDTLNKMIGLNGCCRKKKQTEENNIQVVGGSNGMISNNSDKLTSDPSLS